MVKLATVVEKREAWLMSPWINNRSLMRSACPQWSKWATKKPTQWSKIAKVAEKKLLFPKKVRLFIA